MESQSTVADTSINSVEDWLKRLNLFPYKLQLVKQLQADDPAKRLAFRENFMAMIEED